MGDFYLKMRLTDVSSVGLWVFHIKRVFHVKNLIDLTI